jgi:hypothetical protein
MSVEHLQELEREIGHDAPEDGLFVHHVSDYLDLHFDSIESLNKAAQLRKQYHQEDYATAESEARTIYTE